MRIIVRAHYLRERDELERSGASAAVFEEAEAAVALARLVLADTGIHRQAVERKLRDIRLQLITDNFATIRSQRVASVMIPWARVRWLSSTAGEHAVLEQIAQERFSRWPVVDPRRGVPSATCSPRISSQGLVTADWTSLIRPLKSVHPDESVDATLTRMQEESASLYLIEDARVILGLITLEDILEQVVGQLEDEDEHDKPLLLTDAIARGGIVGEMEAGTRDASIHELVSAVPSSRLPVGIDAAQCRWLSRRRGRRRFPRIWETASRIPHARCPGLSAPLVVIGRSKEGVLYSTAESVPVRLFFLLVTPAERPESQLALLRQVARLADKEETTGVPDERGDAGGTVGDHREIDPAAGAGLRRLPGPRAER